MHASTTDDAATDVATDGVLDDLRARIRAQYGREERDVVQELLASEPLDAASRATVRAAAIDVVEALRRENNPTLMESFLGEYGLSTREGVGLMCLAEALLRVPDADTIDELIADKLDDSDWAAHLGHSRSPLVNASTWALMLTGRLLDDDDDPVATVRPLLRRLGEPVVRRAVAQAMRLLGKQFVLGRDIGEAVDEARTLERRGYTYSYDMLGEAARTDEDARRYAAAYAGAIERLARVAGDSVQERPGISVKLSALHPRYEHSHHHLVMEELLPRARALAMAAAQAGIGFNLDAEEADRLDLSLDVIEALLSSPELGGWDGFGVVVQAYGRRAMPIVDWLVALARRENRRIMVRLVKGAYWDTEIKEAQTLGVASFPVFTRKANTDLSYLACAHRLLANRDVLYPQFATHNAHTVMAIHHMAGSETDGYEFQRLHGMGEALHETLRKRHGTRCRIYAPVGAHKDLLAYLVRRLLENGANSSFVNQIVDTRVPAADVASDPIEQVMHEAQTVHPGIRHPSALFAPERPNSRGFRINDPASVAPLMDARADFDETTWNAAPTSPDGGAPVSPEHGEARHSPSRTDSLVGHCVDAVAADVGRAIAIARDAQPGWAATPATDRADCLRRAADRYEDRVAELCALDAREAGKTLADAISEVREAADFLRYYAAEAERIEADAHEHDDGSRTGAIARGVIACISPWNFPLAIFTGQIAGALAAGNAVIAKPAEQAPLIAARATALLHEAGVPEAALQLLPGDGAIGAALTGDARVDGVCFTGSTATARLIERSLAERNVQDVAGGADPNPLLIAETGGLNAMIVDSTALTEQVVRDVIVSSFQSAGQRCSALRMLYVQKEARARTLEMLTGAMDALVIGDPWALSTDVGPVIDGAAKADIDGWIETRRAAGTVLHQSAVPPEVSRAGHYVAPTLVEVSGIEELEREVFGPVLHVATFEAHELEAVVDAVNARGYGLTFGLHTRIDDRVQRVVQRVRVGNVYVNRNQIGAVVGSQPFGGEGLSGTGPKAGGPLYVRRFTRSEPAAGVRSGSEAASTPDDMPQIDGASLEAALSALPAPGAVQPGLGLAATGRDMPGPTGESNRYSVQPRGPVLVVAHARAAAMQHVADARAAGCPVLLLAAEPALIERIDHDWQGDDCVSTRHGLPTEAALTEAESLAAVALAGAGAERILATRRALAARDGALVPLITVPGDPSRYVSERHVCIDTTAAGGNASLLAATD